MSVIIEVTPITFEETGKTIRLSMEHISRLRVC